MMYKVTVVVVAVVMVVNDDDDYDNDDDDDGGGGGGGGGWDDDDDNVMIMMSSLCTHFIDTGERWSVFKVVYDHPGSNVGQCVALTPGGDPVVLNCETPGAGVACKKALPRVYALTSMLNRSAPEVNGPLDSVHMFERMLPPVLTSIPSWEGNALMEMQVSTDTHCAFQCYSNSSCRAIELSCVTEDHCATYRCLLFPDILSK
ncbi:methylthioribose-1-phosphate isomerase [Plakobranchus ocellatus]|uniref:Methylthioribose-1-phosphate isomerase n=1 Tax=Plakobranchus ocellatus TaxID=259542 RepID=A0AAV4CBZ0_9GAST|nr:methylthioribose-1-phosphate isomerase [Plakobranchus ocellatus]